jgi:hypothetical protein
MKPMSKQKKAFLHRAGFCNNHHIRARSRGGDSTPANLIRLDERRHAAYHLIFGDKTFKEAAMILLKAEKLKGGKIWQT